MIGICLHTFGHLARTTSTTKVSGIFERTVEAVEAEVTEFALEFVSLIPMAVRVDVAESVKAATIGDRGGYGGCGGDV